MISTRTKNAACWLAFLCAVLSLIGCARTPAKPLIQTRIVEVPGPTVTVGVPLRFTAPTPGPAIPAGGLYCADLERLVFAYAAALKRANADKAVIRSLSPPAEKTP